ncbi:argininosuccinate lyase domain protein [Burkholderia pseudomallei 305]|nr:argininosuccinate lyase domain protein [Burkholderia pseudomallei 305]
MVGEARAWRVRALARRACLARRAPCEVQGRRGERRGAKREPAGGRFPPRRLKKPYEHARMRLCGATSSNVCC